MAERGPRAAEEIVDSRSMKLGVPKETFPGERRVAIVPAVVAGLRKLGIDVVIERGAGEAAGFPDSAYQDQQAALGSRGREAAERTAAGSSY